MEPIVLFLQTAEPQVLVMLGLGGIVLLILLMMLRANARAVQSIAPIAQQMAHLGQSFQQLRGGVQHVSDAQANAQVQMIQTVETRLSAVQQQVNDRLSDNALRQARALADMQERLQESLHGSTKRTVTSLTQLQERLAVIDKAQDNITKLSGDVLGLQDILANKQTRGAFGEIQLNDIVSKALPADSYAFQHTLSNGKRADCLIYLPNPPGPIVIDSKFPLEPYEALRNADTQEQRASAARQLKAALRAHIRAISEKYILDGETADGALMFLPSEAVYAELHANFSDIVREGFSAKVWIVSPTTCMATLNTMRAILKDARMREQAGAIRSELAHLHKDVERLGDRVGNLDRHFGMAAKDIAEIKISADKAGRRAQRLDNFDFEEIAAPSVGIGQPGDPANVVPLGRPES
ncbi:RmuC DNA recombination family protein [Phaeobacter inhibens]|uniref:DNA recombination protein RmuC homolog n=1 Tax=Phaeobacter inhibens TaxID=221822 RepID=A0A2I7KDK9_9RHOB|nr:MULTISPECIES: DNA recombination protein RmuC [Phaeobacter]AUQ51560.1 RmuC DNA recombination family protein [Phaeobacter inhibens]AUQ96142.1 RmuC DNA recombination family protein [Phaeobacter inhibens]AUR00678.1 RmuC DNA recombination family protein [Phaeobacter inhibens]AUR21365.1 RmuC DNA recombination family protein [Phaeobacter inhibens]MBQ4807502.1 DNA recombination protein RmuC [Phaeobacter sp. HS012]